jgi:hypothetical protein
MGKEVWDIKKNMFELEPDIVLSSFHSENYTLKSYRPGGHV